MEDFSRQKIVWAEIARTGNAFTLDNNDYLITNTGYMLVTMESRDEKHIYNNLLTFLNSKAILFYLNIISTRLDETGWRWLRQYVETLPIPQLTEFQLRPIISDVQEQLNDVVSSRQEKIESFVNGFYNFSEMEIIFLNGLFQK